MNDDFNKVAWNLLVEDYRKNERAYESVVQHHWEEFLGDSVLFGYSKVKKEIQAQPTIPIGSSEKVIPDILVNRGGTNLFLVELKRYGLEKTEEFKDQLFSYMTNHKIHCSVGILVCQNLTVYFYDFASQETKELEIPFELDNPWGIEFVELFAKKGFDEQRVKEFIERGIQDGERRKEMSEKLREPGFLESCVAECFQKSYSPAMVKEVLSRYDFDCQPKSVGGGAATGSVWTPPVKGAPSAKVSPVPGKGRLKLGKDPAIELARKNGYPISNPYNYSSNENNPFRLCWSNANVNRLDNDWWFLCDDVDKKELFVFFIPKGSLQAKGEGENPSFKDGRLLRRANEPMLLDLKVNPKTLVDERSKVDFRPYLKKKIPY